MERKGWGVHRLCGAEDRNMVSDLHNSRFRGHTEAGSEVVPTPWTLLQSRDMVMTEGNGVRRGSTKFECGSIEDLIDILNGGHLVVVIQLSLGLIPSANRVDIATRHQIYTVWG